MSVIGFLARILALTALFLWLANAPGTAQITWHNYVIETSAAFLVAAFAVALYIFALCYRFWRSLFDGPRAWRLNKTIEHHKKGEEHLAFGLSAIAGGQSAIALKHAKKAYKILGSTPATQLLRAQAAQLAGDIILSKTIYQEMTGSPDSSVLGYRGLIMQALREGKMDDVTHYVHLLGAEHPDLPWLNLVRYDLAVRLQHWPQAFQALGKAKKSKAVPVGVTKREETSLLLAQAKNALMKSAPKLALGHAEKARKLDPDWIPTALIHAEALIVAGKQSAAIRSIEKAWKKEPHPQLVPLYRWAHHKDKPIAFYKKLIRLTRHNKEDSVSVMALAEGALKADLWGEARRLLTTLMLSDKATQATYIALARLEQRETHSAKAEAEWTNKAVQAPADTAWHCSSCSKTHDYWEPSCKDCGAFNSLEWHKAGQSHATSKPTDLLNYLS